MILTRTMSAFYRTDYYPPEAYNQSKLAQVLFTRHLQMLINQDEDLHVQIHAVHPGVVDTDLFVHSRLFPWFKKLFFKVCQICSYLFYTELYIDFKQIFFPEY